MKIVAWVSLWTMFAMNISALCVSKMKCLPWPVVTFTNADQTLLVERSSTDVQ